jgi:CitMHS family citrate-Mg2+:H+ or citrate-Ca2+:H+ symporter
MLAWAGFLTIGAFLSLILVLRVPVLIALIAVPIVAAVLIGAEANLGAMALDGIKTVAPVCALVTFAILYFGLMIDAGLFRPLVYGLSRAVLDDPVRLCVISALMTLLVAFDGDGACTFLITISALLPIHRRMGMNPLVLPTIVGLGAGVMNMLPWAGPTARVMAVTGASASAIFTPNLPALGAGILWVLFASWCIGRRELRRLTLNSEGDAPRIEPPAEQPAPTVDRIFWFNLLLTIALITLLFTELVPLVLLFMIAFIIALPINRRGRVAQQKQIDAHAPSIVLTVSMIFAAGIFTGVLTGTGMVQAMAETLAGAIPGSLAPHLSKLVGVAGMPLSLVFTPDAFYYGVLPVFSHTATAVGLDPLSIARAALLGHTTTGFPLSPLAASTFILIGLSEVSLRDHQRFMFKWAFGTTVIMTFVAAATGAI